MFYFSFYPLMLEKLTVGRIEILTVGRASCLNGV